MYLWFGLLKFFPSYSPAENLATDTITTIFGGFISAKLAILLLAIWETLVGVLLILNVFRRPVILMALLHMTCTFSSLFLFPDTSFTENPLPFDSNGAIRL